jgi:hypothetical protein
MPEEELPPQRRMELYWPFATIAVVIVKRRQKANFIRNVIMRGIKAYYLPISTFLPIKKGDYITPFLIEIER